MNPNKMSTTLPTSTSVSSKQMRKLWDAEIARAWQEMQNALALNQSGSSY